jgi:PadR family transcriptional regulator PadR
VEDKRVPERITKQLLNVLEILLSDSSRRWYGLELIEQTKLSSGTLYPLLCRLVEDGWLERKGDIASDRGGTGRRLYVLTGVGQRAAIELLAERATPRRSRPRGTFWPGAQPT